MYSKWLEFKNNPANTKRIKDDYKEYGGESKFSLEDDLFNKFIRQIKDADDYDWDNNVFNIETCLIKDFPLNEQIELINKFVPYCYRFAWSADYEIVKCIYILWNKYMVNNSAIPLNKEVCDALESIRTNLLPMATMTQDELWKLGEQPGKSKYYNWHLLACLPLLGDEGLPVLNNIIKMRYGDAEDLLMFGLYQYDPKIFYNNLKQILLYWYKHDNIGFSGATGMLSKLELIIKKYKKHGISVLHDPELKDIFYAEKNGVVCQRFDLNEGGEIVAMASSNITYFEYL
jgi:hypothetical protein